MNLKKIPIEGSVLKEIKIYGNAKDCDVTVKTKNPDREVYLEMRDPELQIELQGKFKTAIFDEGEDKYIGIRYLPLEDTKLEIFEIDYPSTDAGWQECLEHFQNGQRDFLDWGIDYANLKLTPIKGGS